ncbi:MAG: 16S rRNA processing protein RimM [Gemmatimonadaceae bacterium]|nr:16S rRNA processing protein RimM [Gemmatimonadaceae bacterium]
MPSPEWVIVGRLRKSHGLRGEIIVEPITDAPAEVYSAGRVLFAGDATGDPLPHPPELTVGEARPHMNGLLIVRFEEMRDRDDAARWTNRYLFAPAAELEPIGEGEVYQHELEGMQVVLESGEPVGTVTNVFELPQGLALDVAREKGTVLIPFNEYFIHEVKRAERTVVIAPPPGLLD